MDSIVRLAADRRKPWLLVWLNDLCISYIYFFCFSLVKKQSTDQTPYLSYEWTHSPVVWPYSPAAWVPLHAHGNVYSKHALAKQQAKRPYINIFLLFPFFSRILLVFIIFFPFVDLYIFALVCIFAQLKKFPFSIFSLRIFLQFSHCLSCVIFASHFFFVSFILASSPGSLSLHCDFWVTFWESICPSMCPHAVRLSNIV